MITLIIQCIPLCPRSLYENQYGKQFFSMHQTVQSTNQKYFYIKKKVFQIFTSFLKLSKAMANAKHLTNGGTTNAINVVILMYLLNRKILSFL